MSRQMDDAYALSAIVGSPGWAVAMRILDGLVADSREELFEIMARRPETLTGKSSLKLAIRAKALIDFKESVTDELKILLPTPGRGGAQT